MTTLGGGGVPLAPCAPPFWPSALPGVAGLGAAVAPAARHAKTAGGVRTGMAVSGQQQQLQQQHERSMHADLVWLQPQQGLDWHRLQVRSA